jgi:hypothetical protein
MLKKNINISSSSDFGDDIGDIEIKIDGDDQQPNRDDQDGDDQDGDDQDGDDQDRDDQDGDNQDRDDQDGDDDTPTPPPTPPPPPPRDDDDTPPPPPLPIEEFELQSLTLLLNNGFKFHRLGDRSMLEYQYLLFNTNSYTTFYFLERIASVRFLPSEDRYYAQSKLDVIEDEMGELTNEIVDQIKEIDKKLLEYIIINFKLNGDYYNEDGFYRYMYDKYRNMLLSVASKSSSEFQINDNPRFVIASANDSGKEFIFNSYSMSLELEGSCKLFINDDEKKVNFESKTRIVEDVMDLSDIIYQLKNQIFVVGGLNIYDKNSSEITKEFLYYVNLIN